jgi:HK97 family phage portal protein
VGLLKHIVDYYIGDEVKSLKKEITELRASLENPATPLSAIFDDHKTAAGVTMTEAKSLAIGAVYACVKVISETGGLMDLEVVEKVGKFSKVNTSHPNYWLLYAEPSPDYNAFEWKQGMLAYALLWGNGYSWVKRDRFATAKELKIIPAWEVTPKRMGRGKIYYEWDNHDKTEIILQEDMIHLKNLGTDGLIGMSPIELQRESLGSAYAKLQHEGAFYQNGAKASGILMTPGHLGKPETKRLQESFDKANEGAKNRFKTILLEEGVKYQQLTIPQNDAQFLESKKFDQTEIAGWYRVPPHMIGNLNDANYSNIDAQDRSFAKNTMVPWTTRFQQEIDRKLFFAEERGKFKSQFNLDDLIKGDIKTRYEVYNTGIQAGILKPTEPREAEGWPMENTKEIDQYFMNGTMMPVKTILAKPAEPTQQTPPKEKAA